MAGVLDFLTQNTDPSATSSYSQNSTQLPPWYQDYTQQILNNAQQYAQQGYQQYQGPRIAATDKASQDAYAQSQVLPGQTAATSTTAQNLIKGAANVPSASQASNPYLNAATDPAYNAVGAYMNPYTQNVTTANANLANQNLTEKVLPALQDQFTAAGNITGGSTREADMAARAARDNSQALYNANAGALQSGYQGALGAAQNQQNLNLNAGQTAGQMATSSLNNQVNVGTALQNANVNGAGAIAGATNNENAYGQQNQGQVQSNYNLAYQDFLNQQNYPMQKVQALQTGLNGIQIPTGQQAYTYGSQTGTGPSALNQLGGLFQTYMTNTT